MFRNLPTVQLWITWAMVSSMEITSSQELAHCPEQFLLLRNHRTLPCQAAEHRDEIFLTKPWNPFSLQQLLMTTWQVLLGFEVNIVQQESFFISQRLGTHSGSNSIGIPIAMPIPSPPTIGPVTDGTTPPLTLHGMAFPCLMTLSPLNYEAEKAAAVRIMTRMQLEILLGCPRIILRKVRYRHCWTAAKGKNSW